MLSRLQRGATRCSSAGALLRLVCIRLAISLLPAAAINTRPPSAACKQLPSPSCPPPPAPGMALQLRFFTANSFALLFALLWLFLAALSAFCYFVSTFVNSPQGATAAGFGVFLVRICGPRGRLTVAAAVVVGGSAKPAPAAVCAGTLPAQSLLPPTCLAAPRCPALPAPTSPPPRLRLAPAHTSGGLGLPGVSHPRHPLHAIPVPRPRPPGARRRAGRLLAVCLPPLESPGQSSARPGGGNNVTRVTRAAVGRAVRLLRRPLRNPG